jgi:hypothetical protein
MALPHWLETDKGHCVLLGIKVDVWREFLRYGIGKHANHACSESAAAASLVSPGSASAGTPKLSGADQHGHAAHETPAKTTRMVPSGYKERTDRTESLQLFVDCESDPIRVVPQKGSEKFVLPDLPSIRILLRRSRMFRGAPEEFPSLATLVDPQGGVGAAADALDAFDKVMCHKPGELQQAACFGVAENLL